MKMKRRITHDRRSQPGVAVFRPDLHRRSAVLIGTFASVITLTSAMWLIQTGRLVFP
jgi:hypothetical protein